MQTILNLTLVLPFETVLLVTEVFVILTKIVLQFILNFLKPF